LAATKQASKFRSFRCPEILVEGVEQLKERWPSKLKNAQIFFLAAVYACQKKDFKPKDVSIAGSETETQMIRVTSELLNCIDKFIDQYPEMTKTDFYILALTDFLLVCQKILKSVEDAFVAEGGHNDRGLVLKGALEQLFADKEHLLDKVCEEVFDAGDKVYCVTTRKKLANLLLEDLFDEGDLDPRKVYKF
jgi:uncharacterized pyridoxamine 5'-phosphate oxidase family protein